MRIEYLELRLAGAINYPYSIFTLDRESAYSLNFLLSGFIVDESMEMQYARNRCKLIWMAAGAGAGAFPFVLPSRIPDWPFLNNLHVRI